MAEVCPYLTQEYRVGVPVWREQFFNKPHYLTAKVNHLLTPTTIIRPQRIPKKWSDLAARGKPIFVPTREGIDYYWGQWNAGFDVVRPSDLAHFMGLGFSYLITDTAKNTTDKTFIHSMVPVLYGATCNLWTSSFTIYESTLSSTDDGSLAGESCHRWDGVSVNNWEFSYALGGHPTFSVDGFCSGAFSELEIESQKYKQFVVTGLSGKEVIFNGTYYDVDYAVRKKFTTQVDPLLGHRLQMWIDTVSRSDVDSHSNMLSTNVEAVDNRNTDLDLGATDDDLTAGVALGSRLEGFTLTYSNNMSTELNQVTGQRVAGFARRGDPFFSIGFDFIIRLDDKMPDTFAKLFNQMANERQMSVQIACQGQSYANSKEGVLITIPNLLINSVIEEENNGIKTARVSGEAMGLRRSAGEPTQYFRSLIVDVIDKEPKYHQSLGGLTTAVANKFTKDPTQTTP